MFSTPSAAAVRAQNQHHGPDSPIQCCRIEWTIQLALLTSEISHTAADNALETTDSNISLEHVQVLAAPCINVHALVFVRNMHNPQTSRG
ncbi:hypothetical protein JDV02_004724 [Purpureocillium takamizusanense]|uniref:Uncharacterized protein n=1 Tax=Purpureocillium takamizusanense TaxID=2060973 RepID=A0A9Q8VB25_9HYPO|nr:uncharacterized protein JDV02_004724 [Purpureocillium takamizusanense]UNI18456.1 hypothetical protein JDV02_004724 [Purpureocillium takamizusanense]